MNRLTITTFDGKEHIFETEETFEDFDGMEGDGFFSVNETALFNPEHVISLKFEALEDDSAEDDETDANPGDPAPEQKKREVLGGFFNRK